MSYKYTFGLSFLLLCSCNISDDNSGQNSVPIGDPQYFFSLMNNWYLWEEEMPQITDIDQFNSTQEVLDTLIYDRYDRWTYIYDAESYYSVFEEGQYVGFGFSYGWDINGDVRFRYVYDDSPMGRIGVKRGWKILSLNGQDVHTINDWDLIFGEDEEGLAMTFELEDETGKKVTHTLVKDIVTMNTVHLADTMLINNERIGYLVFSRFLEPSKSELDEAFEFFENADITKLILDLRYNTGGRLSITEYLGDKIVQQDDVGKFLYRKEFNSLNESSNFYYILSKNSTLQLDELIILNTGTTASASELIINGFSPLMVVTLIGTENTYGKPVGSRSFPNADQSKVFSIIITKSSNFHGTGDYYDGFTPDFYTCDDLIHEFGSPEETMLTAAIEFLETGSVTECRLPAKTFDALPDLTQEEPFPNVMLLDETEF